MGWQIHCEENTVILSKECADEIIAYFDEENGDGYGENYVCHEHYEWSAAKERYVGSGTLKLNFIEDHMEHMDYMWRDEVQAILCKHKVNGCITFMSAEGDNAGDYWGYEFEDGKMFLLEATVEWSRVEENA